MPLSSSCSRARQRPDTSGLTHQRGKQELSMTDRRFAFFHETEPPAGGEGWESMYPYYLVSSAETRAEEESRLWFADTMHWSRGCYPLGSVVAEAAYLGAGQNSTRIFALPTSLGLDLR